MNRFIYSWDNFLLLKNYRILFMLGLLTGCSTIPGAINPVEWYNGARDVITGSGTEKEAKSAISSRRALDNKSNGRFEKLSSVPARPKVLSGEERKIISGGLIGDVDATRNYSREVFGRQSKARLSPMGSKRRADPVVMSPSIPKSSKSDTLEKPLLGPNAKLKKKDTYLVPPKPLELSFVQNKTKSMSKVRKLPLPSKSPVYVRSKNNKLPAVNPNPPKIGNVPGFKENIRKDQTIVISGSGMHQMSFAKTTGRVSHSQPPSISNVSAIDYPRQLGQRENQQSYQIATILFSNGSSQVGKSDRRVLRKVIAQYRKTGGTIRIVGHASRRSGTNDPLLHKLANFEVSAARAERVAQELVKMGVKANNVFVASVSDREPRYYEYMPSGEAGNRRAEIFIDFL